MKIPKARKLPSDNWFIQLKLGGQSIPVTAATETECKRQATLIKAEYLAGKRLERVGKKEEPTLEKIVETYINSRKAVLSVSTIVGYEVIKNNRFQAYMKKRPSEIGNWQAVINNEVKTISAKTLKNDEVKTISAKTLKNSWALVAAALEYSGIKAPSVKLPQVIQKERPWLDADQVKTFVAAVKGQDCEIPALLALHSLRRSEILGLTWERVDIDGGIIHVEGSAVPDGENRLVYKETNKTKNSRRNVPIMIPALKDAILAIPEDQRKGFIYTKYRNTLWRDINRICEANGLPQVGVHGLRHSFVSLAHHVGLPEQDAMMIGGWEDAQTMHKIYEHISEKDRLRAENKIAEFFRNSNEISNET